MPLIRVSLEDFDVATELSRLQVNAGAVASFIGIVRGDSHGRALRSMTLEHYPAMTEHALAEIASRAMQRWNLTDCTIIHRIGRLKPGARIVLAAAASAHRKAALEATTFLIDWLKTDAPFWKREELSSGESVWVTRNVEDDEARARWAE